MLDTMNDRRIGRDEVLEKFGVPPEKVGDVLALMGDSVDNVPGVPGIGPKTASQLIQQFGDLETVLASTDQITKPKLKQNPDRVRRGCAPSAASWCGWCAIAAARAARGAGAQGHPDGAAAGLPRRPGVQDAAQPADQRRQRDRADRAEQQRRRINDVMTAMEPKSKARRRPEQIEVDRSKYETVTDEATLDRWIAEAPAQGYRRDRHRDRLHRLHHRQARRASAWRPRPTAPATSRSGTAAPTFIRTRPTSCRGAWCSAS